MRRRLASVSVVTLSLLVAKSAFAGAFDPTGNYRLDPTAVASIGFEVPPDRYFPADADASCVDTMFEVVEKPDALEGSHHVELHLKEGCAERFLFSLPKAKGSYRATAWMRHGGIDAAILVLYEDGSGLATMSATMTPTGRTTSDGWVELASNEFPVDGAVVLASYLKVVGFGGKVPVEVDALEVTRQGDYWQSQPCSGLGDPVCGPESTCVWGECVLGRLTLPVLPKDEIRNDVVDTLQGQLRLFYGGKRSRAEYLPGALARMDAMRSAKTAWEFWSRWVGAIHALHDWHTNAYVSISSRVTPKTRLNACFIEGDADLSHALWPKDPSYPDILVSHSGPDGAGLRAGDRLIAVDGQHPIAWAASLGDRHFGYHVATDPAVYAELVESLGGSTHSGNALILQFAHELTVLRCDAGGCADKPETLVVPTLLDTGEGQSVSCDNRPFYHLEGPEVPDPETHRIFGKLFLGSIAGTTSAEAIYGMTWDNLYGGGPTTGVNPTLNGAINDWKANARGVILDHRAGNGGTLDAASNLTRLIRPKGIAAVMRSPMELGGFDGPDTPEEGVAIFNASKGHVPYDVGASDWAVGLPVALITHRDGSASDYLPYGMKGAPNVRIFGPHATAGAFSTYIELAAWGVYFQIASGDTIGKDGSALIGHGVEPDVTLLPRQSDLVAGKDTLFEAALAWVRQEIGP